MSTTSPAYSDDYADLTFTIIKHITRTQNTIAQQCTNKSTEERQ